VLGNATQHRALVAYQDEHGEAWDQKPVGVTVALEPGFVNAPRRHSSGARWYVPGQHPNRESARVRLPAIVTCPCAEESQLSAVSRDTSGYAQANNQRKSEMLFDELMEDAESQFANSEPYVGDDDGSDNEYEP
jgi:hypothetical protein